MKRIIIAGCAAIVMLLAGCKCGCLTGTTAAQMSSHVSPADADAFSQSSKG
ncbi:hypothetical protein ACQ9LF_05450 [Anaerohalosphaeraceae bacterium U12dextr]